MPKLWDYDCECGERFEATTMLDSDVVVCPTCNSCNVTTNPGGRPFSVIIPMHRTSLRSKAGYVHTHADRPAEKGSVSIPANKGDI
jgi:hypothetical protein